MRIVFFGLVAAIAVAALSVGHLSNTGDVEAHGLSPAKLVRAGWSCEVIGEVHCFGPGGEKSSASINVMVFDTDDPTADHAPFLGTEILIRADLYSDQPCPQDNLDHYHGLDLFGDPAIDYYACHHYDTSP